MTSNGGELQVKLDTDALRKLYVDLKDVEGKLRVELRRGIAEAAKPVAEHVKANASWSNRIPGAVRVKSSFTARNTTTSIEVDKKKAPHARALENSGKAGTFRHPVYGNRENWVEQPAHPFFYSAAEAATPEIERHIAEVADRIARAAGFTD